MTSVRSPISTPLGLDDAPGEDQVEAAAQPTMRGRRCVLPSISGTPAALGKPSFAVSVPTRRSHQSASFEAPGEGVARDRRDRRLRRGQPREAERAVGPRSEPPLASFSSVVASVTDFRSAPAQKAFASRQHQHPRLVVLDEPLVAFEQGVGCLGVDGVAAFGTGDGEERGRAGALVVDLVAHLPSSTGRTGHCFSSGRGSNAFFWGRGRRARGVPRNAGAGRRRSRCSRRSRPAGRR